MANHSKQNRQYQRVTGMRLQQCKSVSSVSEELSLQLEFLFPFQLKYINYKTYNQILIPARRAILQYVLPSSEPAEPRLARSIFTSDLQFSSEFEKALFFILFFYSLFFFLPPVTAGTEILINADEQYRFAADCFSKEDYHCAATEFKRFVFFFPQDPRQEQAAYQIGLSLYRSDNYREAIHFFHQFQEDYGDTDYTVSASFLIARAYLALDRKGDAIISLNNLAVQLKDLQINIMLINWYIDYQVCQRDQSQHYRMRILNGIHFSIYLLPTRIVGREQ